MNDAERDQLMARLKASTEEAKRMTPEQARAELARLDGRASTIEAGAGETLQARVAPWMLACFNPEIAADRLERNDRFIEEAIELVQASDYPRERAHALVEYVYGRPPGDINQEVGGVMITLAAHCLAHGVDMHEAGEIELARISQPDIMAKIRAKQAAKPTGSALPIASAPQPAPAAGMDREPHIFLDCDGVLADFDAHALAYFGKPPRQAEKEMGSEEFWRQLEARGDFYRSMPVMDGARDLYEGVKHLHPTILTGCPKGNWAQGQKVAWAAEHFPGVPIITCRSADKRDYAKPGDVLIDDWPQHRHRWIEMGGHFIVHHDAKSSLAALWAHYPRLHEAEGRTG